MWQQVWELLEDSNFVNKARRWRLHLFRKLGNDWNSQKLEKEIVNSLSRGLRNVWLLGVQAVFLRKYQLQKKNTNSSPDLPNFSGECHCFGEMGAFPHLEFYHSLIWQFPTKLVSFILLLNRFWWDQNEHWWNFGWWSKQKTWRAMGKGRKTFEYLISQNMLP